VSCQEVQALLIDDLYGELPPEVSLRIQTHLTGCEACRRTRSAFQALSSALDRWETPAVPSGLGERTIARLVQGAEVAPQRGLLSAARDPFLPLLFGSAAAVVALLLTAGEMPKAIGTPLSFGFLGALWSALFGAAFLFVLSGKGRTRSPAGVALLAAGFTLLFTPLLSIPEIVEFCQAWAQGTHGSLPFDLLLFAAGMLYTAFPVFLAGLLLGRQVDGQPFTTGLRGSLLYLLLFAPAVYLQCASLSLGIMATWIGGALSGALTGAPAGLWIRRQRAFAVQT